MQNKINETESRKMGAAYINQAKDMAGWLLSREHRGPGDTIDAAAHRLERRYGVPSALVLRLRHREVKDMLMSNFMQLAAAYQAATERMEKALEHEKAMAAHPRILRLANLIHDTETQSEATE